jgi:hypothetical protein
MKVRIHYRVGGQRTLEVSETFDTVAVMKAVNKQQTAAIVDQRGVLHPIPWILNVVELR